MKRVMIFIDGSNLYHNLRSFCGRTDIDFAAFVRKLVGEDRELIRVYYYNAPVDRRDNEDKYRAQQRFFATLNQIDNFDSSLTV